MVVLLCNLKSTFDMVNLHWLNSSFFHISNWKFTFSPEFFCLGATVLAGMWLNYQIFHHHPFPFPDFCSPWQYLFQVTELMSFLLFLQHFMFSLTQCWIVCGTFRKAACFSHFGWSGFHWWLRGVAHSFNIWGYTSGCVTAFIIWIRNVNALSFKIWFCSSFSNKWLQPL